VFQRRNESFKEAGGKNSNDIAGVLMRVPSCLHLSSTILKLESSS
jgi:hypothetical protein